MQENLRLNFFRHTQNRLEESLIKCLQLIARPLLMRTKLSSSAWGYAILYVVALNSH